MVENNISILSTSGFGISNGVSTILALLAGFYASRVSKLAVITALIALLITDPLSDAYSIYISMKDKNEEEAWNKFMGAWGYQLAVQAIFLGIVIVSPTIAHSLIIGIIFGSGLIIWDYSNRFKSAEVVVREYGMIMGLVVFVFMVDKIVYERFK